MYSSMIWVWFEPGSSAATLLEFERRLKPLGHHGWLLVLCFIACQSAGFKSLNCTHCVWSVIKAESVLNVKMLFLKWNLSQLPTCHTFKQIFRESHWIKCHHFHIWDFYQFNFAVLQTNFTSVLEATQKDLTQIWHKITHPPTQPWWLGGRGVDS